MAPIHFANRQRADRRLGTVFAFEVGVGAELLAASTVPSPGGSDSGVRFLELHDQGDRKALRQMYARKDTRVVPRVPVSKRFIL